MIAANQQTLVLQNYTETNLYFGPNEAFPTSFSIVPSLLYDVIIGIPFLRKYDATLKFNPFLHAYFVSENNNITYIRATPEAQARHCSPLVCHAYTLAAMSLISFEDPTERAIRTMAEDACSFCLFEKGITTIPLELVRDATKQFRDRFPDTLPACRPVDRGSRNHAIELLPDKELPHATYYGFTQEKRQFLAKKIHDLLTAGIILRNEGSTPACSPGFMVLAKGKKPRLVGDYRALNAATRPHAQDIPSTQEVLDELGLAKYFTLSDMQSGYFQLRIIDESQAYTTFATPLGRFMYTVTAMGLRNAGSDFQKAVSACLRSSGLFWSSVINYMDDIIIYSKTPEEHAEHLKKVLTALRLDGWYLAYDKSQIGVTRIKVLGHWVENGKVFPDSNYVTKVQNFPSPNLAKNKVRALQGFLGLVGYYRRFIPNFGPIAAPLTTLIRKNVEWVWTDVHEAAIKLLADSLQAKIDEGLAIFNRDRPTRIHTDASGEGLGATLEQLVDDNWVPIAFFSKALNGPETNLVNYERELFAIYTACKKWLCYLQGIHYEIHCDCNALRNLHTMSFSNRKRRVTTMLIFLGTLSFTWKHIKGSENKAADSLSRTPSANPPVDTTLNVLPDVDGDLSHGQFRQPSDDIDEEWSFCAFDEDDANFEHLCSFSKTDPANPETIYRILPSEFATNGFATNGSYPFYPPNHVHDKVRHTRLADDLDLHPDDTDLPDSFNEITAIEEEILEDIDEISSEFL